jgi:plasmid stabilization system protein ParE
MAGHDQLKRYSLSSASAITYRVKLSIRAEQDLNSIYERISADDSAVAALWYFGLEKAINTLRNLPRRCPIIPESKDTEGGLRHLLYGSKRDAYRVIYEIDEGAQLVSVITIRHSAMDEFVI